MVKTLIKDLIEHVLTLMDLFLIFHQLIFELKTKINQIQIFFSFTKSFIISPRTDPNLKA